MLRKIVVEGPKYPKELISNIKPYFNRLTGYLVKYVRSYDPRYRVWIEEEGSTTMICVVNDPRPPSKKLIAEFWRGWKEYKKLRSMKG